MAKILIVDDEKNVLIAVKRALRNKDIILTTSTEPEHALDLAKIEKI